MSRLKNKNLIQLFLNYSFTVSDRYTFDGKRIKANGVNPAFIQGNGCTNTVSYTHLTLPKKA